MSQMPYLLGAGGLILGFIGGIAIGGATSESKISEAVSGAFAPAQETASAQTEALAALTDRIAALEEAMPDAGEAAERMASSVDEKLAALRSDLSSVISSASKDQKAALDAAMSDISAGLEQSAQAAAAAVASASSGEEAGAGGVAVSEPLRVGETALFADGQVRAFVSRLDPRGGSARLMINGEAVGLGSGGSAPVSFGNKRCSIVVMGLGAEGVTLGSDCDAAETAGGMAQASGEGSNTPPAPDEGFRAGEVAMLADGRLRVYVSGLAGDGSAARIAVNGVTTQIVASGGSVDVETGDGACTVTVTGVGNGLVGLEGSCG